LTDPADSVREVLHPTPDPTGRYFDPEVIKDLVQGRNQGHFGQAKDTPPAKPPLSQLFRYSGVTTKARELLDGNLDLEAIPSISQATKDILEELSKPVPGIQPISDAISLEEMEQGFRQWRESTSTSPSGRHLGHY
jgi:hypothetical protein